MKIGISTSTFFNKAPAENAFEILRNMRAYTTEVCLNTFSEYEKPFVDKLALLRGNIQVCAVSPLSTQFEPQLFSANLRMRSDAELLFKKICYAAFALGAKYYTFRGPINLTDARGIEYDRFSARLSQLCDLAGTYGINLSLKNMSWSYASSPDFFREVLKRCPKAFASPDMFQAETAGYELREFLDVIPVQRIAQIGVCDTVKGDPCLPGNGKYNFEKLMIDLNKRKIIAPLMISVRSNCYTDYLQVRDSYEYLCGLYAKTSA